MTQNPNNAAPLSWHSTLNAGDIVAYRFPHERKGAQQPKVRPALVVNVTEKAGEQVATLAYGTSNSRLRRDALTLDVRLDAELEEASLYKPTRFHCTRRIEVSLEDTAFNVNPSKQTPVLGRLSGQSKRRLAVVRGNIRSERRPFGFRSSRPDGSDTASHRAPQPPSTTTTHLKQEYHHA
ncbi:type II toxin-antitoxin system PemK/MazF family toxin [Sulfitobacter sp.]|uniref:type II toxin-antitoxin system PemK/MazF family toxin n=1 Tax=Sulfitobacter sp. TaxID=1903071 RepID=UPI003EF99B20